MHGPGSVINMKIIPTDLINHLFFFLQFVSTTFVGGLLLYVFCFLAFCDVFSSVMW